jgi:hypothetical protein
MLKRKKAVQQLALARVRHHVCCLYLERGRLAN